MLNVAVVSPDAVGRAALVNALQQTEMVRHVFDYSDAPSTLTALTAAQPEIVLLELSPEDPGPQFEVAAHSAPVVPGDSNCGLLGACRAGRGAADEGHAIRGS